MNSGLPSARLHIEAMRLLDDIWQRLAQMEADGISVAVFQDAWVKWVHLVLAYPQNWAHNGATKPLYTAGRLDLLEALVIVMAGRPSTINTPALGQLESYLNSIMELLAEDAGLDPALRSYLAKLIAEIRRGLEVYKVTRQFDNEAALVQLWVSLLAAEAQSKGHKQSWRKFAAQMKVPVASGILVGLPSLALEAVKIATGGQ